MFAAGGVIGMVEVIGLETSTSSRYFHGTANIIGLERVEMLMIVTGGMYLTGTSVDIGGNGVTWFENVAKVSPLLDTAHVTVEAERAYAVRGTVLAATQGAAE